MSVFDDFSKTLRNNSTYLNIHMNRTFSYVDLTYQERENIYRILHINKVPCPHETVLYVDLSYRAREKMFHIFHNNKAQHLHEYSYESQLYLSYRVCEKMFNMIQEARGRKRKLGRGSLGE
jgi:hypothetical protein